MIAITEPAGRSGQVFWMLAMLGGEADTNQIRDAMAREGDLLPSPWIRTLLRGLGERGLTEQARGRKYRADGGSLPARWRLTPEGRAIAAVDAPDREPCGLGWPS